MKINNICHPRMFLSGVQLLVSGFPIKTFGNDILYKYLVVTVIIFFSGCQTAAKPKPIDSRAETLSAMTAVAGGLSNKSMTEDQLKAVARQVAKDPQAQSALRSINSAFSPEQTVKYCPEDGTRYSADQIWCPDHKVKLEWVE